MRWLKSWIVGYAALLGIVLLAMFAARERALSQWSTPQSIAQWQAWRDDVQRQQSEPHAVERRVPKSDEPPAVVLMRDYFPASLLGALLFSTALYWVIAWFVTGVLKSK